MVMGWSDMFRFGKWRWHSVRHVFAAQPSYLVWLLVNTSHRFQPEVMSALHVEVAKGPNTQGMFLDLINKFNAKFCPGPW